MELISQAILDVLTEGLVIQNSKGKVIQINKAAQKILGTEPIIINEDGATCSEYDLPSYQALHTGKKQLGRLLQIQNSRNKELNWIIVNAVPVFKRNEMTPYQVISTFHDVTEKKSQEIKNIYASTLSSIGDLSAGIAHEINNPLAIICGKAQQILTESKKIPINGKRLIQCAQSIEESAFRISKIIKGLKIFSNDMLDEDFEKTSVRQIIDEALSVCRTRFQNKSIRIDIVDHESDLIIDCRSSQISQALLNLLSNAFDHVERLSEKWIVIEVQNFKDQIALSVTDSGKGVPSHIQSKIMTPFFTTKEVGKGAGLGLSIALGIVKAHKGNLELDTESNNTRFVITLPKHQIEVDKAA